MASYTPTPYTLRAADLDEDIRFNGKRAVKDALDGTPFWIAGNGVLMEFTAPPKGVNPKGGAPVSPVASPKVFA